MLNLKEQRLIKTRLHQNRSFLFGSKLHGNYLAVLLVLFLPLILSTGFNLVTYSRAVTAFNCLEVENAARQELTQELTQEFNQLNHKWEELQTKYNLLQKEKEQLEEQLNNLGLPGNTPTAYLTFDDGPGVYTKQLLQILADYKVQATFFVTGQNHSGDNKIYANILKRGHVLGNHSQSHDYKKIYKSKEAFMEDLLQLEDLLAREAGVRPDIYRFPGGSSNAWVTPDILKEIITELEERGYDYFDWNVSTGDSNIKLPEAQIIANFASKTKALPGNDLVILMHTTNPFTVGALPRIIEELQDLGYRFAPLKKGVVNAKHR